MFKVKEVIVVEGRYDKNTVSQVVDATIIETSGFGIFNDRQKRSLLRTLAEKRGLIVLTDPDAAGFVIRNHISACVPPDLVKHAFVPDIRGKEKRKTVPSKEGKLGVEGMRPDDIILALRRSGATIEDEDAPAFGQRISKNDLFVLGFYGRAYSAEKRLALVNELDLPEHISTNSLVDVLNAIMSRDEFIERFSAQRNPIL